ncbi:palmitoyltransferase ZDHHC12-A isoform X3 [Pyrus x bretschneideri]|uniref:palmitoyltransferase ZDHHC12-A isoform X3 n=1 Tax=Pyrus x bretschneideri TaxID=225117 RepID=UPI0020307FE1|nr:palmitoyltransferase ZDHHC12-A isoform X3 [Pyrus x bretschneideri]
MEETPDERKRSGRSKSIGPCIVSCIFVFLTHLVLSLVPRFFSASSFLAQLALSALLLLFFLGFGGWCRRTLLKRRASAPAFVFFNILFIWGFYISVISQVNLCVVPAAAVSLLNDAVFSCEVVFLLIGLYSIITSDPGFVTNGFASSDQVAEGSVSEVHNHEKELEVLASGLSDDSTEGSGLVTRVRYCRICKAYIRGLDHHCPAFGNCIGQKNHPLFLVLLFGLIITEASYLVCTSLFVAKSGILHRPSLEPTLSENLTVSTILFIILQLVWQINWKKHPEFQLLVQPQPGKNFTSIKFRNPYDKGIRQNVKEFLALRA